MYRLKSGGIIMYVLLGLIVIFIFCIIIIKMFIKDNKHDLVIQIGKYFRFSIRLHDEE